MIEIIQLKRKNPCEHEDAIRFSVKWKESEMLLHCDSMLMSGNSRCSVHCVHVLVIKLFLFSVIFSYESLNHCGGSWCTVHTLDSPRNFGMNTPPRPLR